MTVTNEVPMAQTGQEQLQRWLEGESWHSPVGPSYECCPDFSCCYPALLAERTDRERFVRGDRRLRDNMCGVFLAKFIELTSTKNVVVIVP